MTTCILTKNKVQKTGYTFVVYNNPNYNSLSVGWNSGTKITLVGPEGPTGPTGTGFTGPTGRTGPTGHTGHTEIGRAHV